MALSKLGARLGRKVQSLEYTLEHKISIQKYNKFEIVCHSKKYTIENKWCRIPYIQWFTR